MNTMVHHEVLIVGAGIAGLSAAEVCVRQGLKTAIVDSASPASGASGAPLVITNSATGRRARRVLHSESCLDALGRCLRFAQKSGRDPFYKAVSVLRPAVTEEIARDFQRSGQKYNWRPGDIEWLDPDAFSTRYPFMGLHFGGLKLRHAFTINPKPYLNALSSACQELGLETFYHQNVQNILHPMDGGATFDLMQVPAASMAGLRRDVPLRDDPDREPLIAVELSGSGTIYTKRILYAPGAGIRHFPLWSYLPLSFLKGEVIVVGLSQNMPTSDAISGLGYVASDPADARRVVVGSTFDRTDTREEPTEKGASTLMKKLERLLPEQRHQVMNCCGWAGTRVTSPDYEPVVGEHPFFKGHYVLTALGSRGMLMSSYLSEHLVSRMMVDPVADDTGVAVDTGSIVDDAGADVDTGVVSNLPEVKDSNWKFDAWDIRRYDKLAGCV